MAAIARLPRETATFGFVVEACRECTLLVDRPLRTEYRRYADGFRTHAGRRLVEHVLAGARLVEPAPGLVARAADLMPEGSVADAVHAAACKAADGILVSNDRDFLRVREAGWIRVWSIREAMAALGSRHVDRPR